MEEINNNDNPRVGISWIDYKGKKIIYEDFSNRSIPENLEVIKEGKKIIRIQPLGSLLELVNVVGCTYNFEAVEAMKEYAAGNKPYSKKCAIVGVEGLKKVIVQGVIAFSGREFGLFNDLESAKDWLVE